MASASLQFWASVAPLSRRYTHKSFSSLTSPRFATPISSTNTIYLPKPLTVRFALTEPDSSKSRGSDPQSPLQDIVDSFDLPSDYFAKLPPALRQHLKDAAFDLSKGPVLDECGQELGEALLNLSRAWELADTSTSHSIVKKLPLIEAKLTDSAKLALGMRLIFAAIRFKSMGRYGQGEPQKIADAMMEAGRALSVNSTTKLVIELSAKGPTRLRVGNYSISLSGSSRPKVAVEQPEKGTRKLNFGILRFKITPKRALLGSAIGLFNAYVSLSVAFKSQSLPYSAFLYTNDNDLLHAKSLKEASTNFFFASAFISSFIPLGFGLLGLQLQLEEDSDSYR